MHKYKELKVWQKARVLVKEIYKVTPKFPKEEVYGLTSQIKRSCISIPSNIAEGAGRKSQNDFLRFLDIANGSAFELETQIILAFDLEFISKKELDSIIDDVTEIQKMIYGLKNKLNN